MNRKTLLLVAISLTGMVLTGCSSKAMSNNVPPGGAGKYGRIVMMTPQQAIHWGRENAMNPNARLYVYRNDAMRTYAEMAQFLGAALSKQPAESSRKAKTEK